MGDDFPRFTAAAVQAAPVFLDRDATIAKACDLIEQASRAGARLIVFPEAWVPTYPYWIWGPRGGSSAQLFVELFRNAVEVPGPATDRLGEAARRAQAYVAIGLTERDAVARGSLYNTLLYIGPDGRILGKHRKLMPTHMERTVWGWGDGSGLHVLDTPVGRLGGLICWEHEMSLVKYAMYARGEQVHAAVWPAMTSQNHHIDFGCRQYAFEGRCFVVVSCGYMREDLVPEQYGLSGIRSLDANGGSGIIGPDGEYLAGPLYGREDILYAELDLTRTAQGKYNLDVAGHYARPDVVQLILNETPQTPVGRPPASAASSQVQEQMADVARRIDADDRASSDRGVIDAIEDLQKRLAALEEEHRRLRVASQNTVDAALDLDLAGVKLDPEPANP